MFDMFFGILTTHWLVLVAHCLTFHAPGSARVRKVLVSRALPFIGSARVYSNGCQWSRTHVGV